MRLLLTNHLIKCMKRFTIILIFTLTLLQGKFVYADIREELKNTARRVAQEDRAKEARRVYRLRVERITWYLVNRGSPLAPYTERIIKCSDSVGIRPELIVAIAGKESTFGKFTPKWNGESFNAWGWGVHQQRSFTDWGDGACTVARGLSQNYEVGSIRKIAYKYAPPIENDTEKWIADVTRFMKQI